MLDWIGNDQSMMQYLGWILLMKETSRAEDKKLQDKHIRMFLPTKAIRVRYLVYWLDFFRLCRTIIPGYLLS